MAQYEKINFPSKENYEKITPNPEEEPLEQLFKRKENGQDQFYFKSRIIAMMKYNRWDDFKIKKTGFFGTPHTKPVLPFKYQKDDWLENLTQKLRLQQKRLKKWKLLQCIVGIDTRLEKRRRSKSQKIMKRKVDLLIPIPRKTRSEQMIKETKKYPETLCSKQLDDKFDAQIWYKLVQRLKARIEAEAEAKAKIEAEQAEAAAKLGLEQTVEAKPEDEEKDKVEAVKAEAAAKANAKAEEKEKLEAKLCRTKESLKTASIVKSREEKKVSKLHKKTFGSFPVRRENKKSIRPLADLHGQNCLLPLCEFKFGIKIMEIRNHLKKIHNIPNPKTCKECSCIYETVNHLCPKDTNTVAEDNQVKKKTKSSSKKNCNNDSKIIEKFALSESEDEDMESPQKSLVIPSSKDVAELDLPSVPQMVLSEGQGNKSPQVSSQIHASLNPEMSQLLDENLQESSPIHSESSSLLDDLEPVISPDHQDSGLGSSPDQAMESESQVNKSPQASSQIHSSLDTEMSQLLDQNIQESSPVHSEMSSLLDNVEPVISPDHQDSGLGSSPDQAMESDFSLDKIFAEVILPPLMSRLRDTPSKKKYFNTVSKGTLINKVKKSNLSEGKKSKDSAFKVKEVNLLDSEDESDADLPEIPQKTNKGFYNFNLKKWSNQLVPSQDSPQNSPQDSGLGSSPDQAMESDISVEDISTKMIVAAPISGLRNTPRKKMPEGQVGRTPLRSSGIPSTES